MGCSFTVPTLHLNQDCRFDSIKVDYPGKEGFWCRVKESTSHFILVSLPVLKERKICREHRRDHLRPTSKYRRKIVLPNLFYITGVKTMNESILGLIRSGKRRSRKRKVQQKRRVEGRKEEREKM